MKTGLIEQQKKKTLVRDSNIELYRIITMLLIIAHHYVVNSGVLAPVYNDPLSAKSMFLLIFGAWGKIGINCFVLITGYFMCTSNISAKKFAKIFLEVIFYRTVINSIFWITGYAPFSVKSAVSILLPFTYVGQNFTGTFLIFFLCIPFLNILIKNLNEKQHIRILLILMFTYVFFGTVPKFSVTMNYVSWYAVLYFVSSYIRLYPKKIFENTKFWGMSTLGSVLLSVASVVVCTWLGTKTGSNMSYRFVTDSNTFLALLTGVTSFMFFKNIKMKNRRFINTVSATTFGVFQIHANSSIMRQWLWQDLLDNTGAYGTQWVYLHAIISVIGIFAVCAIIDFMRIRLLEEPFFRLWDKYWIGISGKYMLLENKLCEKFKINTL